MGNKAPAGYASVATDEEAPPTDAKDAKKKLPIADQIEPIAPQAAPTPPLKKDSKAEDKKPERSRFSSESLRDTIRVLRLVLPYVWPENSTISRALSYLAELDFNADVMLRARVLFCVFLLILGKCASIMIPVMYKNIINALPARVPVMSLVGYGLLRYVRPQ